MDKKLDCCVVRDLLPAYIEDLTEEETAAQEIRDPLGHDPTSLGNGDNIRPH